MVVKTGLVHAVAELNRIGQFDDRNVRVVRWLIVVVRMRVHVGGLINLVLVDLAHIVCANENADLGRIGCASILVDA